MKKIYLAAMAVAALTVSSCSQDEVLNINPEAGAKAIEFGVYTGKAAQTRGTETSTTTIQATDAGFGVMAVYTAATTNGTVATWADDQNKLPNFMHNEQVTYTKGEGNAAGTWSYEPVKYWPADADDVVSFFAYAPYTATGAANGITVPDNTKAPHNSFVYTLLDDPTNNADFVAAAVYDKGKVQKTSTIPDLVSFQLKHELTRVDIQAHINKEIANETKVVITDISFYGTNTTNPLYKSATYTYGTENNKAGSWTGVANSTLTNTTTSGSSRTDYSIMGMANKTDVVVKAASTEGGSDGYTINDGIDISTQTSAKTVFKQTDNVNNYLFLLPPNASTGIATAGDVKMNVSYSIATADSKIPNGYIETKTTKVISLPVNVLKQGTAYKFVITVGMDGVQFTAEVDPTWGYENGNNVTVDDQKDTDSFTAQ